MKKLVVILAALVAGCAGVRPEDTDAWVGAPVAALETHPIFATMKLVRTKASDGTEMWNFVNGRNVVACSGGGTLFTGFVDMASYNAFSSCMASTPACNNIFYVKNGRVQTYTPIGSGGMRCYTDDRARPGFRGATNYF